MDRAKANNKSEVVTYLQNWINLPSEEKQNQIQKYRLKLQDNHPPSNQQQQQNAEEEQQQELQQQELQQQQNIEEEEEKEKEKDGDKAKESKQLFNDKVLQFLAEQQLCEWNHAK